METPSTNRRVTRSQAMAASASANKNIPSSKKIGDSEKVTAKSKSRQRNSNMNNQDRSALIDITNDSPIVGLAKGNTTTIGTPLSSVSKKPRCKKTPGSGEALLRGQVKTLLQKVEEDSEIPKFSFENKSILYSNLRRGFISSPSGLLAPTPANTPQVLNFSGAVDDEEESTGVEYGIEDQLKISQVVNDIFSGKEPTESTTTSVPSEKTMITRSLLFDFTDKSDCSPISSSSTCSSVLTYQSKEPTITETDSKDTSLTEDDDSSSIWSMQVNASIRDDEDDEIDDGEVYDVEEQDDFDEQEGSCYDDELLDELCDGMREMNVDGKKKAVKFMGKHVRFVYNSDDEIVEQEEDGCCADEKVEDNEEDSVVAADVLKLKGLPTPKGKHLRFVTEEEESI